MSLQMVYGREKCVASSLVSLTFVPATTPCVPSECQPSITDEGYATTVRCASSLTAPETYFSNGQQFVSMARYSSATCDAPTQDITVYAISPACQPTLSFQNFRRVNGQSVASVYPSRALCVANSAQSIITITESQCVSFPGRPGFYAGTFGVGVFFASNGTVGGNRQSSARVSPSAVVLIVFVVCGSIFFIGSIVYEKRKLSRDRGEKDILLNERDSEGNQNTQKLDENALESGELEESSGVEKTALHISADSATTNALTVTPRASFGSSNSKSALAHNEDNAIAVVVPKMDKENNWIKSEPQKGISSLDAFLNAGTPRTSFSSSHSKNSSKKLEDQVITVFDEESDTYNSNSHIEINRNFEKAEFGLDSSKDNILLSPPIVRLSEDAKSNVVESGTFDKTMIFNTHSRTRSTSSPLADIVFEVSRSQGAVIPGLSNTTKYEVGIVKERGRVCVEWTGGKRAQMDWLVEKILSFPKHPNLADYFGVAIDPGKNAEYIGALYDYSGETLDSLLRSSTQELLPTNRSQIIIGLANGINALHEAGTIHCDITSTNVGIEFQQSEPEGEKICRVKITGFVGGYRRRGFRDGTFAYRAPELMTKTAPPSIASDVYAMGLVFYEIYTGKKIDGGYIDAWEIERDIIRDVTLECLENEPSKRPSLRRVLSEVGAVV